MYEKCRRRTVTKSRPYIRNL